MNQQERSRQVRNPRSHRQPHASLTVPFSGCLPLLHPSSTSVPALPIHRGQKRVLLLPTVCPLGINFPISHVDHLLPEGEDPWIPLCGSHSPSHLVLDASQTGMPDSFNELDSKQLMHGKDRVDGHLTERWGSDHVEEESSALTKPSAVWEACMGTKPVTWELRTPR